MLPVRSNRLAWLTVAAAAAQGRRASAPAATSKWRAIQRRGNASHARNTAAFSATSASSGGGASGRPSCAPRRGPAPPHTSACQRGA